MGDPGICHAPERCAFRAIDGFGGMENTDGVQDANHALKMHLRRASRIAIARKSAWGRHA